VRRKVGCDVVVWRQLADGSLGCAAPCVFCQRELQRFGMRVHCRAPDGGWFSGRLDDPRARPPAPRLTSQQRKALRRDPAPLCGAAAAAAAGGGSGGGSAAAASGHGLAPPVYPHQHQQQHLPPQPQPQQHHYLSRSSSSSSSLAASGPRSRSPSPPSRGAGWPPSPPSSAAGD